MVFAAGRPNVATMSQSPSERELARATRADAGIIPWSLECGRESPESGMRVCCGHIELETWFRGVDVVGKVYRAGACWEIRCLPR